MDYSFSLFNWIIGNEWVKMRKNQNLRKAKAFRMVKARKAFQKAKAQAALRKFTRIQHGFHDLLKED